MILLDTNVASELMRSSMNERVEAWLASVEPREFYISTITRAEIQYGIQRLPDGRRKESLMTSALRLFTSLESHTLSFDNRAADLYGTIASDREKHGRPIGIADAQIAAIASANSATLATRNIRDFIGTGIDLVDPFA